MPWSERFVQDHKRQTDRAIHRAYANLAANPAVSATFDQLLACTRQKACRLLDAPVMDGRHAGVDALINLARFRDEHLRPLEEWTGSSSSWRPAVSALAGHLTCAYKIPTFLASTWYANDACADTKRGWCVRHSRGQSFRSLDLPIRMTRKMEHIFLASQDHVSLEFAMRRAELLALGAPGWLIKAILATGLPVDLRDGDFWRTVWLFLVAHARELEPIQVGPILDYLQAVRREQNAPEPQGGLVRFGTQEPPFSMNGRSVPSLLRLISDWHRSLGEGNSGLSWNRSPFEPMTVEERDRETSEGFRRWHLIELTNHAQLRREGTALHHCVASYAAGCSRGTSSIWSLRVWQGGKVHHRLTVQVDPKRGAVIQARGYANRAASGRSLRLLEEWATRERLLLAL